MRALILGLMAATSFRVCEGSDDRGANETTGISSQERAAARTGEALPAPGNKPQVSAKFGGSVVRVGGHAVELLVHRRGLVEAFVRTHGGEKVQSGDVKLSVRPYVIGGARPTVKLAWEPDGARLSGSAGAKVTLAPKPARVTLEVDGKAHEAMLTHYALITGPHHGGQIVVAGDFTAEVLADASGEVRAFVSDAVGTTVEGAADLGVRVTLPSEHQVTLEYDRASLSFVGKVAAGGRLFPGPLSVSVKRDGHVHVGTLDAFVVGGKAEHGGQIVVAGDYSLELVAGPQAVAAYVFDASGKAHTAGDLQVELGLGAANRRDIELVWDPPTASYRATVGAGVDARAVPIVVSVRTGARVSTGRIASLDAKAKLQGDARLSAEGTAKAKAPTLNASLNANQAASATATATRPKVAIEKSARAKTTSKSGAKARAGFSFGTK